MIDNLLSDMTWVILLLSLDWIPKHLMVDWAGLQRPPFKNGRKFRERVIIHTSWWMCDLVFPSTMVYCSMKSNVFGHMQTTLFSAFSFLNWRLLAFPISGYWYCVWCVWKPKWLQLKSQILFFFAVNNFWIIFLLNGGKRLCRYS